MPKFRRMMGALVGVVAGACGAEADPDTPRRSDETAADEPVPRRPDEDVPTPADPATIESSAAPESDVPVCEGSPMSCVDCSTWQGSLSPCVDGVWQCTAPQVPDRECPGRNCEGVAPRCCDRTTGSWSRAACLDAEFAACPEGTDELALGEECIPEGYDVSECGDLRGLACPGPMVECKAEHACGGARCRCEAVEGDAGYTWVCATNAC